VDLETITVMVTSVIIMAASMGWTVPCLAAVMVTAMATLAVTMVRINAFSQLLLSKLNILIT